MDLSVSRAVVFYNAKTRCVFDFVDTTLVYNKSLHVPASISDLSFA